MRKYYIVTEEQEKIDKVMARLDGMYIGGKPIEKIQLEGSSISIHTSTSIYQPCIDIAKMDAYEIYDYVVNHYGAYRFMKKSKFIAFEVIDPCGDTKFTNPKIIANSTNKRSSQFDYMDIVDNHDIEVCSIVVENISANKIKKIISKHFKERQLKELSPLQMINFIAEIYENDK